VSGSGVQHSDANDGSAAVETTARRGDPVDHVEVQILRLDPDIEPPGYAHPGDAGADLRIAVDAELAPGERRLVGTGVAIALPDGYVGLVHPRSGLAATHGLTIVNAPGTVDAGYRGEIKVCLINTDQQTPVRLTRGDRIAQLVIQRVSRADFRTVSQLPGSVRGTGGHGSTGVSSRATPQQDPEQQDRQHRQHQPDSGRAADDESGGVAARDQQEHRQ
jgi:dUTP pyrophosphatase